MIFVALAKAAFTRNSIAETIVLTGELYMEQKFSLTVSHSTFFSLAKKGIGSNHFDLPLILVFKSLKLHKKTNK